MLKTISFAAAALVLAGCATLQDLAAEKVDRAVNKNDEGQLANWAYWDNQCKSEPFTITIDLPPANGRTEIRDEVYAIPTAGCGGAIIESKAVYYIPNPDFVGADTVRVTYSGSTGTSTSIYNVTVQ